MPVQTTANIGTAMLQIHNAITRSMELTRDKCLEFNQLISAPSASVREGFLLYVSTMGMIINAHHLSEDDVIFPRLRVFLNQAPFDELSAEHKVIDVILEKLRQNVAKPTQGLYTSLLESVTQLIDHWAPHIAKEKKYIYSPEITEAFMRPEEHLALLQETSKYAMERGNPVLMVPFLLYNLNPEERTAFSAFLPPEMIQNLVPVVWKPQWVPMQPFFVN